MLTGNHLLLFSALGFALGVAFLIVILKRRQKATGGPRPGDSGLTAATGQRRSLQVPVGAQQAAEQEKRADGLRTSAADRPPAGGVGEISPAPSSRNHYTTPEQFITVEPTTPAVEIEKREGSETAETEAPANDTTGQGPPQGGAVLTVTATEVLAQEDPDQTELNGGTKVGILGPAGQALAVGTAVEIPLEELAKDEAAPGNAMPLVPANLVGESEMEAGTEIEIAEDEVELPHRYQPPKLATAKADTRATSDRATAPRINRPQALEMRVRARSDRYGFCEFQLLAQRSDDYTTELELHQGRRTIRLSAISDDWFEVSGFVDIAEALERGAALRLQGTTWELRGRALYVLAPLHGISGFVSTTRLDLGRDQIVLCRQSYATQVEAVLAEAGCGGIQGSGTERGAPGGWVFYRSARPSRAVPQAPGNDILNLVRPVPDIEILLEGGLWLRDSTWMAGYPPEIHVSGEIPVGTLITIDGAPAEQAEGGNFRTAAAESIGTHVIWCGGKTASFSISEPEENWEQGKLRSPGNTVCGAFVTREGKTEDSGSLISVPTSNPILIGAKPGEIFRCDSRPGTQWMGFVPFPVSWALPADPLHCDRSVRKVLVVNVMDPFRGTIWGRSGNPVPKNVLQWCHVLLDCRRKGLAVSPGDAEICQLWRDYATEAKRIRRMSR